MSNTTYKTGLETWTHGENMGGYNEWNKYLGPCPSCGTATFDYGGGWRCLSSECYNGAHNPISNLGPEPKWWNSGIQVFKDGNSWCAVNADFVNLQESNAGFGKTPNDAVTELLKCIVGGFKMDDFEKGLMLMGLVSPKDESERKEKEALDNYENK